MSALQNKNYAPVYFLGGDESYFIDKISDYIQENALDEAEKSFNQTILYGKETDATTILNAAKRFPMMTDRQVVIIKEAQEVKDFENLIHYIENPLKSTILVLSYKHKKPDKRKKVFKSLQKNAVYFEVKKMYDDQVPGWITNYVSSKGYSIEHKAAMLLVEFLGSDLSKISNEIDKLIISLDNDSKAIGSALIERNIGISKDYNVFELQNALGSKDALKANRIINYFSSNPKDHSMPAIIAALYNYFSKILIYYWIKDKSKENLASEMGVHPYFVKDYVKAAKAYNPNQLINSISLLREYDMKSKGYKGVMISQGDLLKELIFKIIH